MSSERSKVKHGFLFVMFLEWVRVLLFYGSYGGMSAPSRYVNGKLEAGLFLEIH
jgi:hypothetical protein